MRKKILTISTLLSLFTSQGFSDDYEVFQTGSLCDKEQVIVDNYRKRGYSAPKSTKKLKACFTEAGRPDLVPAVTKSYNDFVTAGTNTPKLQKNHKSHAPARILHLGDSHADGNCKSNYTKQLQKCTANRGVKFMSLARSSATPSHYTKKWPASFRNHCKMNSKGQSIRLGGGPRLRTQLKKFNPDHVLITLGDNVLGYGSKNITNQYKKLIDLIKSGQNGKGRSCTLVTPTQPTTGKIYTKKTSSLFKVIRAIKTAAKGRCKVIDSTKLLPAGMKGDGVHHTPRGYDRWGKAVCNKLELAHSIRALKNPKKSTRVRD